MKITQKSNGRYVVKSILFTIGAIAAGYASYRFGYGFGFFVAYITLFASFFLFAAAVSYAHRAYLCRQSRVYEFTIKEDTLLFDAKSVSLKDETLFFKLLSCGDLKRISLYVNDNKKIRNIFENVIFDDAEYKAFISVILPYKKLKRLIPHKTNLFDLYVCEEGFAIEGEEFLYDEIVSFKTETQYSGYVRSSVADVTFQTVEGKMVKKRFILDRNMKRAAKLLYIQSSVEKLEIDHGKCDVRFNEAYRLLTESIAQRGCETS